MLGIGAVGVIAAMVAIAVASFLGSRGVAPVPVPARHTVSIAPSNDMFSTPTPLQWKPVIEQLDHARGLALMQRDIRMIAMADVIDSPSMTADTSLIMSLLAQGAAVRTYPLRVLSVTEQYVTVGEKRPRALLTVTDTMGAYDLVDKDGHVLRHVPARGKRTWSVELRSTALWGWQYYSALNARSA